MTITRLEGRLPLICGSTSLLFRLVTHVQGKFCSTGQPLIAPLSICRFLLLARSTFLCLCFVTPIQGNTFSTQQRLIIMDDNFFLFMLEIHDL